MIDVTSGLKKNLSNNYFSSYAVITASVLAAAAFSARDWLPEKLTSIALTNLGPSSLCLYQSIYPNYPLLQQPGILEHPDIALILWMGSSGSTDHLLQQLGILEHPNIAFNVGIRIAQKINTDCMPPLDD